MIKLKDFLDTCDFVPYVIIYTLEEEGPVFEGDAHFLYRQDKYKQLLTSSVENWGSATDIVTDITDRLAFWITLDVVGFIPFDESYRKNKLSIKESDDKITAKNFQELISKLEDHGYSCEHYYDMRYPDSNWLYITKNGDPYEAEFYRYDDGEYELYLHNIHPTRRRNECVKRRKQVKENFYRVWYNPYDLERDEEDFMEVTAETEEEARRRVSSSGYVTSVEEIESLTDTYDESRTRSKRNKLLEKSNFNTVEKAIKYYYPKWYYDDMSVNDIYDRLEKLGHSQDFIDAVIDGITSKYENEEDYELDDYDECLDEANVVGMGGGYQNVYLPKAAKEYLKRKGFQEVNTEIGPCFYMGFTGNDVWEIYIDEQYGGIYVVQEGYELRPTDDIATIDDKDYKDDIDSVINLGNCLSNGEDFDSCIDAFFN